ncbi:MAG: hypothetical protein M1269_06500 [Chloroflexi bacterium]|nr:hypothetical protein [Chloroflexota bacterium]
MDLSPMTGTGNLAMAQKVSKGLESFDYKKYEEESGSGPSNVNFKKMYGSNPVLCRELKDTNALPKGTTQKVEKYMDSEMDTTGYEILSSKALYGQGGRALGYAMELDNGGVWWGMVFTDTQGKPKAHWIES